MPLPSSNNSPRPTNRILSALSPQAFERIAPDLEPFALNLGTVLYSPGEEITAAYFPERGVISLVTVMQDGRCVEAAAVGREGLVGLPLYLGRTTANSRWIVQVPDGSYRLSAKSFLRHIEGLPELRLLIDRYASDLIELMAQLSACNAIHSLPERCARWLLVTADRMGTNQFHLTHEFLAEMLGVYRPQVTVAASSLQASGLIRYRRGDVEITNRDGLEEVSCECYEVTRRRIDSDY
ncbi:MAG: Crp/Fnr family transcriptional regulator [Dehalococcoidia bacterium]